MLFRSAMETGSYTLQYHLYALALHLHLGLKSPYYNYRNSFGGIFYILLRGVDDSKRPGAGIFYDLPDINIINRLGRAMIPGYKKSE